MARVLFILTSSYIASKGRQMSSTKTSRGASPAANGDEPETSPSPADEARELPSGKRPRWSGPVNTLPFGLDCLAGGDCCKKKAAKACQHVDAKKPHIVLMRKSATFSVPTGGRGTGTIHLWKKTNRGAEQRSLIPGRNVIGLAVALAALTLLLLPLLIVKMGPWSTTLLPALAPQSKRSLASEAAAGTSAEAEEEENESGSVKKSDADAALLLEAFVQLQEQILDVRSTLQRLEDKKKTTKKGLRAAPRASFSSEREGGDDDVDVNAASLMECGKRSLQRPTTDVSLKSLNALRWEMMNVRRALWRLLRHGSIRQCRQLSLSSSSSLEQQLPDFASEVAGGAIVATPHTRAFASDEWETLWGIPVWRVQRSPRLLIQSHPSLQPGACWAFRGMEGQVVVALAEPARVAAVGLEHVTAVVTGTRQSAPRVFEVTGLILTRDTSGVPLGRFEYDLNGPSTQTFPVKDPTLMKFRAVLLHILNNHGNPQYTCVYRFRVHGYTDTGGECGYVP